MGPRDAPWTLDVNQRRKVSLNGRTTDVSPRTPWCPQLSLSRLPEPPQLSPQGWLAATRLLGSVTLLARPHDRGELRLAHGLLVREVDDPQVAVRVDDSND